jgi:hypothetical protein
MIKWKNNPWALFLCLLKNVGCPYSIKKFLAFIFMGLIFYLAIWTDNKESIINSFLFMLTALLAIRSFDKVMTKSDVSITPSTPNVAPPPTADEPPLQ